MVKKFIQLFWVHMILIVLGVLCVIFSIFFVISKTAKGLPESASYLIDKGVPEEILINFQNNYSNIFLEGYSVFPITYGNEREIRIDVGEISNTLGGHWKGSSVTLTLEGTGMVIEGYSKEDEWSNYSQGPFSDALVWIKVPLSFSESDNHKYFEGTASVLVNYPGSTAGVNTWSNQSEVIKRNVRFFVISPDEKAWMAENLKTRSYWGMYLLAIFGVVLFSTPIILIDSEKHKLRR